jgi:hypothetical protein
MTSFPSLHITVQVRQVGTDETSIVEICIMSILSNNLYIYAVTQLNCTGKHILGGVNTYQQMVFRSNDTEIYKQLTVFQHTRSPSQTSSNAYNT